MSWPSISPPERINGIVALIMAIGSAMLTQQESSR
jgi:hypothetical protein